MRPPRGQPAALLRVNFRHGWAAGSRLLSGPTSARTPERLFEPPARQPAAPYTATRRIPAFGRFLARVTQAVSGRKKTHARALLSSWSRARVGNPEAASSAQRAARKCFGGDQKVCREPIFAGPVTWNPAGVQQFEHITVPLPRRSNAYAASKDSLSTTTTAHALPAAAARCLPASHATCCAETRSAAAAVARAAGAPKAQQSARGVCHLFAALCHAVATSFRRR